MKLNFYGVLLLLLVTCFNRLLIFAFAKSDGVCVSHGGRFPPYSILGKPPRRVSKGPKDLTLCRVFRKKTCCDVVQTHPALLSVRKLASTGEANEECLHLWELLECSICDPHVGVQPGPPIICASLCNRIYQACSSAYFSMDAKNQVLAPCAVTDTVCGRASEWITNGTDLCKAAGFAVKPSNGFEETSCYGGKASLDSVVDSWRGSQSAVPRNAESSGKLDDFQQWVREMPINERVSWAVGGLVLTAGLLFVRKIAMRAKPCDHWFPGRYLLCGVGFEGDVFNRHVQAKLKRKSHNQRERQAAIQRTARKLGGKMSPKFPASQANRNGSRR